MGGFDRSKYKATPMSAVQQQDAEHDLKRPSGRKDKNRLSIELGDNKFRLFPVHPDGGGKTYSESRCISFLPLETKKRDKDGKVIEGEVEIKRRPVFNSKVHGDLSEDLCEVYLEVAKNIAIPEFTEDAKEQETIWKKVTGMEGVKPKDSWVVYAAPVSGSGDEATFGEVGLLEFGKTVKDQIRDKALEFIAGDITSPDPYTDPDDGICIVINKSGKGLDTKYTVELDTVKTGKFKVELVPTMIPDEVMEVWSQMEPLYKMNVGVFKKSDLELQIEGLTRFDESLASKGYPIRVIERPEFLEAVERLIELVPDGDPEGEDDVNDAPAPKVKPKATVATAPKPKVRTIPKKQPEPEPEEEEEYEEEEEVQEEEQEEEEKEVILKSSKVQDKLAEMRAKLKKK